MLGKPLPIVTETIQITGGPYRLAGELSYAETGTPWGLVVMANPHPMLGGDMRNNVVRELTDRLAARGMVTLRFNYRGVGGSEGPAVDVISELAHFWETSHIAGELELHADIDSAIEFLRSIAPAGLPLSVIGYSFGCALLPLLREIDPATPLVMIAPTIGKHSFDGCLSWINPLMVIAPEDDFATDVAVVHEWFDRLVCDRQLLTTRMDDHFFRGHEAWLAETIFEFLQAKRG